MYSLDDREIEELKSSNINGIRIHPPLQRPGWEELGV
jgi:hypothetical protein